MSEETKCPKCGHEMFVTDGYRDIRHRVDGDTCMVRQLSRLRALADNLAEAAEHLLKAKDNIEYTGDPKAYKQAMAEWVAAFQELRGTTAAYRQGSQP